MRDDQGQWEWDPPGKFSVRGAWTEHSISRPTGGVAQNRLA